MSADFLCPFGWLQDLFAQSPDQKFSTKTQATDIYQICSTAVGSCFITDTHSKMIWGWATHIFANIYVRKGVLEGCVATFGSQRGIRSALGLCFRGNLLCTDFGSRFERAVLQTVLQMDLPTRCILCALFNKVRCLR